MRFPILGSEIPPMLGRQEIMQRIWNNLTKPTPNNLMLVGPRFVGKSIIMNALAEEFSNDNSPYDFVIFWHLGHVTPKSDDDFISQLSELMRKSLENSSGDFEEHQEYLRDHSFDYLKEVTDSLDSDGKSILMLWDGFDKPLGQGNLSGHLWDQMRAIFYGKKHKIVIATRKPLRELIRSEDAITSPFWNIFDMNPVKIKPFDETDRDTILSVFEGYNLTAGAKTELFNWSSGIPPLFLEILNQIELNTPKGRIDNAVVNQAAGKAIENLADIIHVMWNDCTAAEQDFYSHLAEVGELPLKDVSRKEKDSLIENGFAMQSGNKIISSCRLLKSHLQNSKLDTGSVLRLFGTWDSYRQNIRNLLERRFYHIPRFDERLFHLVERIIADIPDYPDDSLNNLNSIRDCALQLIWQHEFGPQKSVPSEIITYWTEHPRSSHNLVQSMMNSNSWDVSTNPLDQIRLLGLLTGSVPNFISKSKSISKDTYILIDAIHNFRNRTQHAEGQEMRLGVAITAIMGCIELLACLENELPA